MSERYSPERLEMILASLSDHLVTEEPGRLQSGRRRLSLWGWVAAALIVAVALVTAIAPARQAIADWLGIGSTVVRVVPDDEGDPSGLATLDDAVAAVTVEAAEAALGRPLPRPDSTVLGAWDQVGIPPEGGVIVVWSPGATTLWVHASGPDDGVLYKKLVVNGADVRTVDDLGERALLIVGAHVLDTPHRRLSAGTVLLWTMDGYEYRLESDLPADTMIDVARRLSSSSSAS